MKIVLYLLSLILIVSLFRKDKKDYLQTIKQECLGCGKLIENDLLECPYCKDEVKRECVNCVRIIESNWRECPFCGYSQDRAKKL